jgi:CMP/dCMP kinase
VERLQKVLAQAGIGSRRACEEIIAAGRVSVDGQVVTQLGTKVDPETARITVDGKALSPAGALVHLALNKPPGYITTAKDTHGRKTVMELLPRGVRLYPAGRLDADSEGLLFFTNDGEWANRVIHPRYEHEKEYEVLVAGRLAGDQLQPLRNGVSLEEGMTAPAKVDIIRNESGKTWLRFVIREGRKRQIRRMLATQGVVVERLIRVRIGPVRLDALPPGKYRCLTQEEVSEFSEGARPSWPSTITIDGPAGAGKSTIGQLLADKLGYLYFDTGAVYRALALAALRRVTPPTDESGLSRLAESVKIEVAKPSVADGRQYDVLLDGEDVTWDIRTPAVDATVSDVSVWPGVRDALVEQQRSVAKRGHVVMVGRDVGTVILPDADLKIYLEASAETGAKRRFEELAARGARPDYAEVLKQIKRRDEIDSGRAVAPLKPAEDACIVDTEKLNITQVVEAIEELIRSRVIAEDSEE